MWMRDSLYRSCWIILAFVLELQVPDGPMRRDPPPLYLVRCCSREDQVLNLDYTIDTNLLHVYMNLATWFRYEAKNWLRARQSSTDSKGYLTLIWKMILVTRGFFLTWPVKVWSQKKHSNMFTVNRLWIDTNLSIRTSNPKFNLPGWISTCYWE